MAPPGPRLVTPPSPRSASATRTACCGPRAGAGGRNDGPREVELKGRRVPVVGRVTMDMSMVAVDEGDVSIGDVATIFGGLVTLDEQARGRTRSPTSC